MASGPLSTLAGLRSLPSSAVRTLGAGVGFVVLIAALFAGVGAWQDRDATAAPDLPAPAPGPGPAPAPTPEEPGEGEGEGEPGEGEPGEGEGEGQPVDGQPGDTPAPAPEPSPAPPSDGPRPADVSVQLLNAAGEGGADATTRIGTTLQEAGFRIGSRNTAGRVYEQTTVFYTVGFEAQGRLVASVLAVNELYPMTELPPERRLSDRVMVHVVVGQDARG